MWITTNNTIEETDYQDCDEGPCPSKLQMQIKEISVVFPINLSKISSNFKLVCNFKILF